MPGPSPHRETIPALAREQFPALAADPAVVYLDSAATTQKPRTVINTVTAGQTANPGRGSYPWSARGAQRIAEVRAQAARFFGAASAEEIVFTAGATAGLNAVARSWGPANLADGDEILYSPLDHISNVYPWLHLREVLARFGRRITLVPYAVTAAGEADTADIAAKGFPRTRLITVAHVHHVFGGLTTLEELRGRLGPAVRLCFDCTQSAGHIPVDVDELGCDFAVISGHKMFGIAGTGVLYARRRVRPELASFLPGGGTGVRLAGDGPGGPHLGALRMPDGLEGGTPDLAGISALEAAMEFIDGVGLEPIAAHNRALTRCLAERLSGLPRVTLLPGVAWAACPVGQHAGRLPRGPAPAREPVPPLPHDRVRLPGQRVLPAAGRLPPPSRARRGQPGQRRRGLARRRPAAGIRAHPRRVTSRTGGRRRCSSRRCSSDCHRCARYRRRRSSRSCTDHRYIPGSRMSWPYSWRAPLCGLAVSRITAKRTPA